MANTIKIKRSAVSGKTPTTTDVELGELAINTYDGKLFLKKNDGTEAIVEIGAGGGGATSIDGLSDAVTYNSGQSIGLGANALDSEDGGLYRKNTAVGYDALTAVTTGQYNVALGYQAGKTFSSSNYNTAIGTWALQNYAGTGNGYNTAVGYFSGNNNTTCQYNTYLGGRAGYSTTSGSENVFLGYQAGFSNTTGSNSIFIGKSAGYSATTASNITAIGDSAGYGLTSGIRNIFVGNFAGYAVSTGQENVAVGVFALQNGNAEINTAVGAYALRSSAGLANTALGYYAGNTTTSGTNNTCLGFAATASSSSVSNEITLGNSSVTTLRCNTQTISSLSDGRDKAEVEDLPLGLDFIDTLRPVRFKWKTRDGNGKDGTYDAGFIAQDLQSAQSAADADYLNMVMDENPDRLEARYGQIIPVLVQAIKELRVQIDTLKANA